MLRKLVKNLNKLGYTDQYGWYISEKDAARQIKLGLAELVKDKRGCYV